MVDETKDRQEGGVRAVFDAKPINLCMHYGVQSSHFKLEEGF